MNESPNKRAITVGVFVLIGIIFLIAGILTIGNLHQTFSTKLHVTTIFDDVNGLQKGNNIWFSGVKIGTVKKVEFFEKSRVRVIMNIDEKAQEYIRKDARVKVSTDGFIGNKILVITGGSANMPAVQEGDTLGIEKTFSTEDIMNTFQENNKNVLAITSDFKTLSKNLVDGHGSLGRLLKDEDIYENISNTTASLKKASDRAQALMGSLSVFSAKLNQKGTFANDLVTDTVVFNNIKKSVKELNQIADTAAVFIANLNEASRNPKTPVGVLLHDEVAGAQLKSSMKNLESGSKKLDEDLEALQHNFLLRRYFKKKNKEKK
ncbi:MAG: MCE family protein [Bacteroidetes bacterium]|nr:MCE family protein [Bacteroidota bacterium]